MLEIDIILYLFRPFGAIVSLRHYFIMKASYQAGIMLTEETAAIAVPELVTLNAMGAINSRLVK